MGCGCFGKGMDWHLLCHIVENVHDIDIVFEAFDEAVDIFLVPRGRAPDVADFTNPPQQIIRIFNP